MEVSVDDFLAEMNDFEREQEITRILSKAFRLNAYDVLNISSDATMSDVNKAFRTLSIQVHPDKVKAEWKERAQQAFARLTAAKGELADEAKKEALDAVVSEAKIRIETKLAEQHAKKRMKATQEKSSESTDTSSSSSSSTATSSSSSTSSNSDANTSLSTIDRHSDEYEHSIRQEVRELLIEREWRKRQALKAAQQHEILAKKEKEQKELEKETKDKAQKEWEEGREDRVKSWRDFQKGGIRGKLSKVSKFKVPKGFKADEEQTFIRRVASNQTNQQQTLDRDRDIDKQANDE